MPSGIRIKELIVGTGTVAERGTVAVANIRGYLRRGDVCYDSQEYGQPSRIDLSKRDCIAGLRKGVEGMRAGGRRQVIVSPHLAYGAEGLTGKVPPNAVIRFEVELLEVLPATDRSAGYGIPQGKHLVVFRPGEAARNSPRWQFGLREGASAGVFITYPIPGQTWRHARTKQYELNLGPSEIEEALQSALNTPVAFPEECLTTDINQLWADASEKANSITRNSDDELCVTITIWEVCSCVLNYSLPETSPVLLESKFYQIISKAMAPYL